MTNVGLPTGWYELQLSEIGEWVGGGTPSKLNPSFWNGDIPWVSPKDMKSPVIEDTQDHISNDAIQNSAVRLIPMEAILFVTRSGILAHSFPVATTKSVVTVNQDIKAIIPFGIVDSQYLAWALRADSREILNACTKHGTTVHSIEVPTLRNWKIGIPPLNEQKRIVAKIEELFSELDNGIAALKTAREQLKVYRQSVLKHAFEGKLTAQWREDNNGESWRPEKLGNLIAFLTSGSRGWAKYYSDSGDVFIRAQNLKYDRLDLDDKAYVSLPEKTEGQRTQVQMGDVLVTITGANVTKTGRVCADLGTAYVSQHVALCRPSVNIDSEFLYWFLIAEPAGRRQLTKFAYGAGKPGLNLDNIRSIDIELPPISEQRALVGKVVELLSIEDRIRSDISTELERVELLRQSILKKAFSGQLVPQDPNDEPASELLARIQAEKAAAQSVAKTTTKAHNTKPSAKRGRKKMEAR